VLADVSTTTIAGTNFASPSQSAVRDQILNGDISGTVNAGVTVNGFGLDVSSSKVGGAVQLRERRRDRDRQRRGRMAMTRFS
jgi:hypothetical protein